jgi:5'-nucleotidase
MKNKPLNILVTNDDGVHAPGIKALAQGLSTLGKVTVMAPDRDRSGASHSLTLSAPLTVHKLEEDRYMVEGTPTDCVHLALTGYFPDRSFDLVVSGINRGANLGDDVIYSGTVGAAIEGRFLGTPSVAVSLVGDEHYDTAAQVTVEFIQHLLQHPIKKTMTISINVPDMLRSALRGFEVTRLGSRHPAEPSIKQRDPRGRTIYWIGAAGEKNDAELGTDFHAVENRFVSITPLHIDLTSYQAFEEMGEVVKMLS